MRCVRLCAPLVWLAFLSTLWCARGEQEAPAEQPGALKHFPCDERTENPCTRSEPARRDFFLARTEANSRAFVPFPHGLGEYARLDLRRSGFSPFASAPTRPAPALGARAPVDSSPDVISSKWLALKDVSAAGKVVVIVAVYVSFYVARAVVQLGMLACDQLSGDDRQERITPALRSNPSGMWSHKRMNGYRNSSRLLPRRNAASLPLCMMATTPASDSGEDSELLNASVSIDGDSNGDVSASSSASERLPPGQAPTSVAVFLLLLLFTANQWARSLVFYLVDFRASPDATTERLFMNIDLGFDEAEYGVIASIGFAAVFSAVSLFAGGIVERVDARNLLTGTAVLWSGATLWQGAATSFGDVLGARTIAAVGQAFSNPASYAILARLFPPERLASVNGLYASGVYFGGGLAAFSILLDRILGWRELTFLVAGIGVLFAFAVQLNLPSLPPQPLPQVAASPTLQATEKREGESKTGENEAEDSRDNVFSSLRKLLSEPTVALLLVASTLRFLAGFTIAVWIVPFYREAFPDKIGAEFALIKACVNGIAGAASATGGGILADRLASRDIRFRQWVPAAGSLLAIPFWIGTITAPTLETSLLFLFLEYLSAECWFGPTIASLQAAAPTGTKGLTTGVFSCLTLVGNFAPFIIGVAKQSGNVGLPELLAYSVAILYAASAAVLFAAGQSVDNPKR